ncbi:MAG: hypothetical protein NTZ48_00845 [Candidatus Omnitrophica bacterium]|nr:hypothetical protein [Candidatus Omnitrophota bacterium]
MNKKQLIVNWVLFIAIFTVVLLIDSNNTLVQSKKLFTQPYEDGLVYVPDEGVDPAIVYADMDGDKIDEIIFAYQMHSISDGKDDNGPFPRSFAYVWRADKNKNPAKMEQIIPLNELLGVSVDDNEAHDKTMEVVDLNNDGKEEVAIWSSGGFHYDTMFIIGMRDGMVVPIFYNGSRCPIKYEPSKNKNIISVGREDWPEHSFVDGTYLEEIWEWNGEEFVYNKDKSTSPLVTEDEDIDKYWKRVLNGQDFGEGLKTSGMKFEKEEEKNEWEYQFKYGQTGMLQGETMDLKKIWEEAIKIQRQRLNGN